MLDPELRASVDAILNQEEDPVDVAASVSQFTRAVELFYFATEYNWDDGLAAPMAIANHPLCDKATALLLFWRADGIAAYGRNQAPKYQEDWFVFCQVLSSRLLRNEFPMGPNSFDPLLSKVQRYKYEKNGVPVALLDPVVGLKDENG